ncbi:hypothetical protein EJB05_33259, partial [Eragrostis curvula]
MNDCKLSQTLIRIRTAQILANAEKDLSPLTEAMPEDADLQRATQHTMPSRKTRSAKHAFENILASLPKPGGGEYGKFYTLPALNDPRIDRLPFCIRILLESAIRNCDNLQVTMNDVEKIINWEKTSPTQTEIPFKPARCLLMDNTGIPAIVDLAAMRDMMAKLGTDPYKINPLIPVATVIDHSVRVDVAGSHDALDKNMELEFDRNKERFSFLKWASSAFQNMQVFPPGSGTAHQVNLEHLARVVFKKDDIIYPDSVVGADSHTTMINGLGIAGWGVGGIEAVVAMLGQPMGMVLPGVIGFKLTGKLQDGVTATDLVLTITQMIRKHGAVGKFVEFYGVGVRELSLPARATIANMAPEYGATMGFFPVDHVTLEYLRLTGRSNETVSMIEAYMRANKMFVECHETHTERVFSSYLELDLTKVEPCVSGPKRPYDCVPLKEMKSDWRACLDNEVGFKGFAVPKKHQDKAVKIDFHGQPVEIKHGTVVLAAVASSTNTSNHDVMIGAGLVAKKAWELGLETVLWSELPSTPTPLPCSLLDRMLTFFRAESDEEVKPWVKTSLTPGSVVAGEYLKHSGLQDYLNLQGFHIAAYGCATCVGNSGDLDKSISAAILENDVVAVAVLSANRNFEGRVHPLTRANYLASPPLVVAYALAGTVDIDFQKEPIGIGKGGQEVYLSDIWPTNEDIEQLVKSSVQPHMFKKTYESIMQCNKRWNALTVPEEALYPWDPSSTYIRSPPYFEGMSMSPPGPPKVKDAYCLLKFGDLITTDHISYSGSIPEDSPAAKYLRSCGVDQKKFSSYGGRRGNNEVVVRGAFANLRIVNKLMDGKVGPKTVHFPSGETLDIFDAAMRYKSEGHDTIIIAGAEYGSGSSRDSAAKGPMLLGVKAVIAVSFERIHRSNLVGMGIIPLCFKPGEDAESLGLTGHERYTIHLPTSIDDIQPGQDVTLELAYFNHGGILPYIIRNQLAGPPR